MPTGIKSSYFWLNVVLFPPRSIILRFISLPLPSFFVMSHGLHDRIKRFKARLYPCKVHNCPKPGPFASAAGLKTHMTRRHPAPIPSTEEQRQANQAERRNQDDGADPVDYGAPMDLDQDPAAAPFDGAPDPYQPNDEHHQDGEESEWHPLPNDARVRFHTKMTGQ